MTTKVAIQDMVVALRNDINTAIDGEELLSRLRPRIKSLFK